MNAKIGTPTRRYDLDWLRVLTILTVFIFHSSRFFDLGDWHVKNATQYMGVQIWIVVLASWMMPLIFVISGASLFYALGKGKAAKFIQDKVLRLLVPLVVGILTHVSLQVYLDRLTHGRFYGSYFDFLPGYFNGIDLFGGNMPWTGMHLWYLAVLFVFSLVFLPLFGWLKDGSGKVLLERLGDLLALPGAPILLALPTVALLLLIDPDSPLGNWENGGWYYVVYITFFLGGFVIFSHEGLQKRIQGQRWLSLAAAVVTLLVAFALWRGADPAYASPRFIALYIFYGLASWSFILAFLGLGMKYLTFSTPFLKYANEAVLPFYVLHQTVLLCVGYLVVQGNIPDLVKFLIIALGSFGIIMSLYELLVRRVDMLRILFGMKSQARLQAVPSGEKALAR
jgi:peptidoglycan/LPS O-acetylase OafA/YrhL